MVGLLAQTVGQPGHLLAGGGPEPAHFLAFGREQAPEHALAQAPTRTASHRGEHVQVVHQCSALVLWDRRHRVPGFQKEQRRRQDALADCGQVG
jgi:hypothetical protein